MTKAEELIALGEGRGCLANSAGDEPVFILVARDRTAPALVRDWADRVERLITNEGEMTLDRRNKIALARRLASAMDDWQKANGRKIPD